MPALRERGDDIGEIAEAILERLARRANTSSAGISAEAVASLQTYPFPGNVRELENVLERALTLSGGGMITPEHVRLRAAARASGPDSRVRRRRTLYPRGARRSGVSSRTSSATRS